MNLTPIRVLLVEDNVADAFLITEALHGAAPASGFDVRIETRLVGAVARLAEAAYDVILLDLGLPDSQGLDTFFNLHGHAPKTPIIVLSGLDDEDLAVRAVKAGAQDYLVKGETEVNPVVRAVRYAIERGRLVAQLERLSLTDDLTQLYNRRGFMGLAEHLMRLVRRTGQGFWLLLMDLDDFKQINDTYGHAVGDEALARFAQILSRTLRESDVVARLGGDEFVALALGGDENDLTALVARLHAAIDEFRSDGATPYRLGMSLGVSHFDPDKPATLDELLSIADELLYEHKRNRSLPGAIDLAAE